MASKSELAEHFKDRVKNADDKRKVADKFIIEILEYEGGWDELIEIYQEIIEE